MLVNLVEIQQECGLIAKEKGWDEEERTFGEWLALMHSELSEALEDFRDGHAINEIWYRLDDGKPCGIPTELADCIIRILHFCHYYNIDMVKVLSIKLQYNKNRPYRHGNKVL